MVCSLSRDGPPFEREAAFAGNDILSGAAIDQSYIQSCVGWIKSIVLFASACLGNALDRFDQMSRVSDCRRPQMRISAVRLAAAHRDFGEAITFAAAHWPQRRRFADDRVTGAEGFCRRQTFRTETANLFVAGEDQHEWPLQFSEIYF